MAVAAGNGHRQAIGTPSQIADIMEDWFTHEAADGFNVLATHMPAGLEDFVNMVVPELQRRGLYRTHYEGTTLRDHLGVRRPASRTASDRAAAAD
jgi:alkanesulfonate monooxygenase